MVKQHLSRAFFGKDNCLKIYLNDKLECYFEFGTPKTKKGEGWNWKAVKFNDAELGEMIGVLEGRKESVSFFHNFKGDKTQIWIRKNSDKFSIKVRELAKGLNFGEQMVLKELLGHCIVRMNLVF
ncbi:MAG: hypothetical protein U9R00_03260 [Patescibacteria group bacterium]|nr:hypothetical protein [Patescibacteria group bacterium]